MTLEWKMFTSFVDDTCYVAAPEKYVLLTVVHETKLWEVRLLCNDHPKQEHATITGEATSTFEAKEKAEEKYRQIACFVSSFRCQLCELLEARQMNEQGRSDRGAGAREREVSRQDPPAREGESGA